MATRAIRTDMDARALPPVPRLACDILMMTAAAFVLRCWWFGDPVVQVDEQFYLMTGDRLLHGAVPFVDIWDRKPVGLFLAYAAIRLLGGDGVVQYQLVAAMLAAGAAVLVVQVARLHAGGVAARLAGVAALVWLLVFDGAGGQAPIFYGPLVAGAALLTLRVVLDPARWAGTLLRDGCAAMALIGLAIQIKYTALFEGLGFGCMLIHAAWRRGDPVGRIALQAAAWITLALLPTALALAWYDGRGLHDAFVYANFRSVGQRPPTPPHVIVHRIAAAVALALPLILAAFAAPMLPARDARAMRARRLVGLWLAAAVIGYLAIGLFLKHYFLPVVLPLTALAAPALDAVAWRRGVARYWPAAAVLGIGATLAIVTGLHRWHARGNDEQMGRLVAAIEPRLDGCLFVFDGDPILYHLTQSCIPTAYAFPQHLNEQREAGAIGIDPAVEVRRILATRPSVIVSSDRPRHGFNPATWALMRDALARDYVAVFSMPVAHRRRIVYQRVG